MGRPGRSSARKPLVCFGKTTDPAPNGTRTGARVSKVLTFVLMLVSVHEAVVLLHQQGVVGLPTETVYGLAARIDSPIALEKIFSTKDRPFFDPLIVHVTSATQAKSLCALWPPAADALTTRFWPGPLTLVLPKNERVDPLITSGLPTVGLRCPRHDTAQEILQKTGVPLAAPSANKFGRTSPTSAAHVETEFSGLIPVVDGGPSTVGIESTVLWLNVSPDGVTQWKVLRPGEILASQIRSCLKEGGISEQEVLHVDASQSPGHLKHHYMPQIPLILVDSGRRPREEVTKWANAHLSSLPKEVEGVRLSHPERLEKSAELRLPADPKLAARELYEALRVQSQSPTDHLIFFLEDFHTSEEWQPILDRLTKAASLHC